MKPRQKANVPTMSDPLPKNEVGRLAALGEYHILDTDPEEAYDDIVHLASVICETPVAAISFITSERQWFKSILGLPATEIPHNFAFCAYTILQPDLMIVPDTTKDPRFAHHPLVTGENHIRFYAGMRLLTSEGHALGSLCVCGREPRNMTPVQEEALQTLARQVIRQLESKRHAAQKDWAIARHEEAEGVLRLLAKSVASSVDGILIANAQRHDMPILYTNAAFLSLTGYEESDVLGSDCRFLQGADTDPAAVRQIRYALDTGHFCRVTVLNYKKDGTSFWNDLVISPVRNTDGELTHFIGIQHDVTVQVLERIRLEIEAARETEERKLAEEAMRASERFAQSALDALSATIAVLDIDGNILAVNQSWQQLAQENPPVDRTAPQCANYLRVCDSASGEEEEQAREAAIGIRAVASGERDLFVMEYPCHSPHERRWFNLRATPFPGDGDARVVVSHENITVRKEAEIALVESEMRFRQMADAVPTIVWTSTPAGDRDYYNQRWYDYSGLSREESLGSGWEEAIPETELLKAVAAFRTSVDEAFGYQDELQLRGGDGEYRWHQARGVPIKNDAGEVVKWVGTYTDITAHKLAEQMQAALLEREHNIAAQLQGALQPELPGALSGLAVSKYYEPSLSEEAGVGGDFYDCFHLDTNKRRAALIVGDVSGKGLAAAIQVAAVRHGLRAALYMVNQISDAVGSLNDMLVEQEALAAFATLFVGIYDSTSRTLSYVNCGQEPALLRRAATGAVEELASTGPILGCFTGVDFPEKTVILEPGDALAIFSDGLTEVGISRETMLGVEGITSILQLPIPNEKKAKASEMAEYLALRMIEGFDEVATGGIMRDDVCLLVAVVKN